MLSSFWNSTWPRPLPSTVLGLQLGEVDLQPSQPPESCESIHNNNVEIIPSGSMSLGNPEEYWLDISEEYTNKMPHAFKSNTGSDERRAMAGPPWEEAKGMKR